MISRIVTTVEPGIVIWVSMGGSNIESDPLFLPSLQGDFHIGILSPCIDAGNPSYTAGTEETDIDGESRISDGIIDIGADEQLPACAVYRR